MRRAVVVGVSGSGKTTLAQRIAELLNIPHIELDAIFWQENWTRLPRDQFEARVEEASAGVSWIVDGNYSPAIRKSILLWSWTTYLDTRDSRYGADRPQWSVIGYAHRSARNAPLRVRLTYASRARETVRLRYTKRGTRKLASIEDGNWPE